LHFFVAYPLLRKAHTAMKRSPVWLIAALLVGLAHLAEAQQAAKVYRIGYITNAPAMRENIEEVFQQALTDLGYRNGQNSVIEWRFSKGRVDHLPDLAKDLVRLNVDCIVALGVAPTRAAKHATLAIPIIMANADDDPVRQALLPAWRDPAETLPE
jgi:ABC-type uncharacterized transport system substrate-binding protein